MTVNTTTNRVSYAGNGTTTAFAVPFPFLADADLVVIERTDSTGAEVTKTLITHYTVSGAGGTSGTVTMLTAPATGVTLVIYRDPMLTQSVDLITNDPLPVETAVEQPLDRLTMIAQRNRDLVERSLRLPDSDTGFAAADMKLPAKVVRASKYLAFDAGGKPIAAAGALANVVVSAFMATVLDDVDAPAARTTLGAASLLAGNTFEGAQVFNEAGADVDFRIEGDTKPNLFFVDASTDRIGVGTATPARELDVVGRGQFSSYVEIVADVDAPLHFQIKNTNAGITNLCEFRADNGTAGGDFGIAGTGYNDGSNLLPNEVFIVNESGSAGMHFKNNANGTYIRWSSTIADVTAERMRINSAGVLCVGHAVAAGVAGQVLLPNAVAFGSLNGAGNGSLSLISATSANRTQIHCNGTILNFDNALTQATAGAVATYLRVRVGGVDRVIPVHAES